MNEPTTNDRKPIDSAPFFAFILVLLPLVWWPGAVDFTSAKTTWLAVGAALAALGVLKAGLAGGSVLRVVLVVPLLLALLAVPAALRAGLHPFGSAAAAANAAAAALTLVAAFGAAARGRARPLVFALAIAPALVLAAQAVLEAGVRPFGIPFAPSRFTATLGNSAIVGLFGVASLFVLPLLRRQFAARRLGIIAVLGAAAPTLVLIYRSDSRAAWIAAALFLLPQAFAAVVRRRAAERANAEAGTAGPGAAITFAVAGIAAGVFGLLPLIKDAEAPAALARLKTVADGAHATNEVRRHLRGDAIQLFKESSFLGAGIGRFGDRHPAVRDPEEWIISGLLSRADHPHNEPLRLLVEGGSLGAAIVLAAAVLLGLALLRGGTPRLDLLAVLLSFGAASWVWDSFAQPAVFGPFAAVLGLMLGGAAAATRQTRRRIDGILVALTALLALVAAMAVAVAEARLRAATTAVHDSKRALLDHSSGGRPPEGILADLAAAGHRTVERSASPFLSGEQRFRAMMELDDLFSTRETMESKLKTEAAGNEEAPALRALAARLPGAREVRGAMETSLRLSPYDTSLRTLAAGFELACGQAAEARTHIDEGLRVNARAPLLRRERARLRLASNLDDLAFGDLRAELDDYGRSRDSDGTWETLVRYLGRAGRLSEAAAAVREWTAALGATVARLAVGGEIALYFGETPDTWAQFVFDDESPEARNIRGAFASARIRGAPPEQQYQALLAHLALYPNDAPVLDALAEAMQELAVKATDDGAPFFRDQRRRAITRSKLLYAFEHDRAGDESLFRISLRAARRMTPECVDALILEILVGIREARHSDAVVALQAFGTMNLDVQLLAQRFAVIDSFLLLPEIARQFPH